MLIENVYHSLSDYFGLYLGRDFAFTTPWLGEFKAWQISFGLKAFTKQKSEIDSIFKPSAIVPVPRAPLPEGDCVILYSECNYTGDKYI